MREFLYLLGKNIGAISGAGAALLWVVLMWDPSTAWNNAGIALGITMLMLVLCIMAIVASWKGNGIFLIVLYVVSFFPIGAYLWTVEHWIRWIGAFNVGFLVAGILIWRAAPAKKNTAQEPTTGT